MASHLKLHRRLRREFAARPELVALTGARMTDADPQDLYDFLQIFAASFFTTSDRIRSHLNKIEGVRKLLVLD
jgi:hypothetical protein